MSETKLGRPTKRTPELDEELLLWVAEGKTIRAFCREKSINSAQIYRWTTSDSELWQRLAHAKDIGAQMLEDEILEIADSGDEANVQHRKLRCWAREKRLIWNNPGKYGTKVGIAARIEHTTRVLTRTERIVRVKRLLAKAEAGPEITVEIEPTEEAGD